MGDRNRIFAKCAWRLIPFMMVLYLVNFLDRTNVAFAALTMNRDLGFTPSVYGFGAGLFFVGYFLCEVPSNLVLARVGARFWIFRIMVTWGLISAGCALIKGPASFYVLRFLLGIAEAGLYPGMLLYLTYWFPQDYRARCMASFIAAAPLAFVVGGPISGFVLAINGVAGLRGWQWLFILEGVPAFLLGFASLKMLPNGPGSARWLSAEEKAAIADRLAPEKTAALGTLWGALAEGRVAALCLILFGIGFARLGVGLWLPLILQGLGFSNLATGFLVAGPYLIAAGAMIFWGRRSDERGERMWHLAGPILFAGASLIAASLLKSGVLTLIAIAVAVVCLECIQGVFWSMPSTFLGGTERAAGIGLIAASGQFGAFVGTSIMGVLRQGTGGYGTGLVVCALALIAAVSVVLATARAMGRGHVAAKIMSSPTRQ